MGGYEDYHATRFDYLLGLVRELAPGPSARILDVGRGPFTDRLLALFPAVTTLGYPLTSRSVAEWCTAALEAAPHIVFDLNATVDRSKWIPLPRFDVIVFAEVVEHLTTAPEHVLAFLATGLAEGGTIICQTPNAAAIHKRIRLLLGFNPYERILLNPENPGHFREYTRRELYEIGEAAGLEVVRHEYRSYFGWEKWTTRLLDLLVTLWPAGRRGQTVIYRRRTRPALPAASPTAHPSPPASAP